MAFKASKFVWLAISEITWMISEICVDEVLIRSMASTLLRTAAPPSPASELVCWATLLAPVAFYFTASMLRASSSMVALISSTDALCV